jgi:hypothetical protein
MTIEEPDPVLDALADLTGPVPRADRAALVRGRCHAALTAARRTPHPVRKAAQRSIDRLLPVAVVAYAVAIVVEGLRLAGVL